MNYAQSYYTQAVGGVGLGNYGSYWSGRPPEHLAYPNSSGSAYLPQFGQPADPTLPPTDPDPPPGEFPGFPGAGAGALFGGIGIAYLAVIVAAAVAINYQLGKAMAPSKDKEAKWAWGNAIGGTLVPPVTVGLAIYKNYFTD